MVVDDQAQTKTPSRKRLYLLLSVLVFEIASYLSLRQLGWFGTGNLVISSVAILFMGSPLLVCLFLLVRARFRFGLKTLFAFSLLAALFLWISVLPLLKHHEARKGASMLMESKASIQSFFDKHEWTEWWELPFERPQDSDRSLPPSWIATIDKSLLATPEDEFVSAIHMSRQEQVTLFCSISHRFKRLLSVSFACPLTSDQSDAFAEAIRQSKYIEVVNFNVVPSVEILDAARDVRHFTIYSMASQIPPMEVEHLESIGNMKRLERLILVGVDLNGQDLSSLQKLTNLKDMYIQNCNIRRDVLDPLQTAFPDLTIRGLAP